MSNWTWEDVGDTPDRILTRIEKEAIAKEWNKRDAELAEVLYIQQRQSAYPSMADQLDYIYHNGVEAWKTDMIDPIKQKYPKPE